MGRPETPICSPHQAAVGIPSRPMSETGPVWLILPTYNEAENIGPVVESALETLGACAPEHTILIVDDNSPDGTGRVADRLASEHERVEVLHRPGKQGLGRAYLDGFRTALGRGAELICEMDSDFSHDPRYLPDLIEAASSHADLALGSRYVDGGSVVDWGPARRFISRGGCYYARKLLGIDVRDLTGGFKCFRRSVLEAINLGDVSTDGYAFQVELTYRAIKRGFKVVELPIVFSDRRMGSSKMSNRIVLEAALKVPLFRLRS